MDWAEVQEPGCYLHLATGLLARIRAGEIDGNAHATNGGGGPVARLSGNPEAPLAALRAIAQRSSYRVNF
jgi:hypothetical protein